MNNITALVQIMVWCQPGSKPLSEQMMVRLLMHICITRLIYFYTCLYSPQHGLTNWPLGDVAIIFKA